MNTERIQQFIQFVQEEPENPFNVYALAMEYLPHDRGQAQHYFEKLLTEHPQYLPTYYHAAQLYADLGYRDRAAALYDLGLRLAQEQNELKTYDELKRAYRSFQDEDDDY